MLIGIKKIENTRNGYELGRFVRARSFTKRIDNDYFLRYRNFICDEFTKERIEKLLKRAMRTHDGEGWRFTICKSVPDNTFYVNGIY